MAASSPPPFPSAVLLSSSLLLFPFLSSPPPFSSPPLHSFTGVAVLVTSDPTHPLALMSQCNLCISVYSTCLFSPPSLLALFTHLAISRRVPCISLVLLQVSSC